MDIFESLENLNVSEECFDDILGIMEELLNESLKDMSDRLFSKHRNTSLADILANAREKADQNVANAKSVRRHVYKRGYGNNYSDKIDYQKVDDAVNHAVLDRENLKDSGAYFDGDVSPLTRKAQNEKEKNEISGKKRDHELAWKAYQAFNRTKRDEKHNPREKQREQQKEQQKMQLERNRNKGSYGYNGYNRG